MTTDITYEFAAGLSTYEVHGSPEAINALQRERANNQKIVEQALSRAATAAQPAQTTQSGDSTLLSKRHRMVLRDVASALEASERSSLARQVQAVIAASSEAQPAQTRALTDDASDAARYRWLRDKSEPGICAFYLSVGKAFDGVKFKRETVDEAIDAQMTAAQPASGGDRG